MSRKKKITRRSFVQDTSRIAMGAMIVPRHVLGGPGFTAPSDILNVAIVGSGGQGTNNAQALVSQNIVAVCDVDMGNVDNEIANHLKPSRRDNTVNPEAVKLKEKYDKAKRHVDWRQMLEKQQDIDAVVIATPDHNHAVIAKAAMELKKHVYVQKPLTYSVHEARVLRETAIRTKVVTQMGNQGHSSEGARLINEWYQAGLIGQVREVHVFTNRPIWPQALPRPATYPPKDPNNTSPPGSWGEHSLNQRIANAMYGNYPKPDPLHWDLYLGPVAEDIEYHPIYHPFNWRGWTAFGVGALGDMGAHLIDHPFWALNLGLPTSIETTSTPWGGGSRNPITYPQAMTVHYEFAARGNQPPVKLSWYDGGLMPPRPAFLPDDVVFNREGQVFFIGDKGLLMHETYGDNPKLFPESVAAQAASVPKSIPRIDVRHEMNWAQACMGKATAVSPFEYSAQLTETMILGIVALKAGQGKKILYDGATGTITNVPDANQYLTREYRSGWAI
jgi:predicted dehydrogenase